MQAYILATAAAASIAGFLGVREGLAAVSLLAAAPVVTVLAAGAKYSKLYLAPGILLLAFWLYRLGGLLG
jgi:hypothetical protein